MIDFVTGKLCEISPTRVVVDNNGIGYAMEISLQTYDLLKEKKEAVVYVLSQVNQREGTSIDYGFANKEERELFKLITSVSGIGASSARMILSSLSAGELREAILSENVNTLKSIKGIGLKSAQRMILELKDKIDMTDLATGDDSGSEAVELTQSSVKNDVLIALTGMGFAGRDVLSAIKKIDGAEDMDLDTLLGETLRVLGSK